MIDRIKAKEKARNLWRNRSFSEYATVWLSTWIGGLVFSLIFGIAFSIYLGATGLMGTAQGLIYGFMFDPIEAITTVFTYALGIVIFGTVFSVVARLFALMVDSHIRSGQVQTFVKFEKGRMKKVTMSDLFLDGSMTWKFMLISLLRGIFVCLWTLLYFIPYIVIAAIGIAASNGGLIITFAVLFIPYSIGGWFFKKYISAKYVLADYIAVEQPGYSAYDSIRASVTATKGHLKELLILDLSFFLWDLIAVIIFGIFGAYVLPYKMMTYIGVYRQLNGSFATAKEPQQKVQPAVPKVHNIKVLSGEYEGVMFPIKDGEIVRIGRDPNQSNIVVSPEVKIISKLHCSIRLNGSDNKYFVTDYSKFGTYINGNKLIPNVEVMASEGDIIKLANGEMILNLS